MSFGSFNKQSSSTSSTSAAQTTQSTADQSTAFGLGNINVSAGKKGSADLTLFMQSTDHGAISDSLDFAGSAARTALSFADDAFSDGTALVGRVLDKQTVANLEFLGEVSNFADLSAQTAREQAELSERQAKYAIGALANTNAAALDQVARFGQDAQTASMKALDYVFEATKSETARLADTSMKWIVGAAVAVFVIPFFLRIK